MSNNRPLIGRYWLLTWTTYGTWLPGDSRGFVSNVRDGNGPGPEVCHNIPGTLYDSDLRGLESAARASLKCQPIFLKQEQENAVLRQVQETAAHRGWKLLALAVMANHVHLVVGVSTDPDPSDLLRDFKSYASRSLNRKWAKPASGTWWTESGSKRKLPKEASVIAGIRYVWNQSNPLAIWIADEAKDWLGESGG